METIKNDSLVILNTYNYCKYYRVNKNDTFVKEVSTNNFKLINWVGPDTHQAITLQQDAGTYSMYIDLGQAMEKAKAGAQAYIEQLIAAGDDGLPKLLQYRIDHYEDLNVNLLDANIQKEEGEVQANQSFEYKPYRIDIPDQHTK